MKEQLPNPLHHHESYEAHVQELKYQANLHHGIDNYDLQEPLRPYDEVSMSATFGMPLGDYGAISMGLFGAGVDIENLTTEQKEKIEAVNSGIERGWQKGLQEFFKERGNQGNDTISPEDP